jgi:DNA ligase (NAD+)
MDGVVAEVVDDTIKRAMGATSHHYRWQIAIKSKGETARTKVNDIKWQVGRTGNVTPVLEVQPVPLSGATIRRVTAHHAGMIKEKKIGINSEVEIIRSGEVIPKLEKVITPSDQFNLPEKCPVCKSTLEWNNDFLKCLNLFCQAQVEQKISHWFKTLGNTDWFGIKTIQKLVSNGYDDLEKIYAMKKEDFMRIGFGPVQAKNLIEAIEISKTKPVEDWRFLAAFGIQSLGKGDSRKLLRHMTLEQIIGAPSENIAKVHGFGEITSQSIGEGMKREKDLIQRMLSLGFNLERTEHIQDIESFDNPIKGKKVVFTGKMERGDRGSLQDEARKFGAIVQSSVSGKTEYLICGDNPGTEKVKKAQKEGVKIITERQYFDLMKDFFHIR